MLHRPGISVLADARIAVETVPVHAMHDPTEGGLATGLLEVALAAQVGLRLRREAIPVLPECRAACEALGLDPLGLIASGALIDLIGYPLTISALSVVGLLFTLLIGLKWRASLWH